jgi:hypothetical protein
MDSRFVLRTPRNDGNGFLAGLLVAVNGSKPFDFSRSCCGFAAAALQQIECLAARRVEA